MLNRNLLAWTGLVLTWGSGYLLLQKGMQAGAGTGLFNAGRYGVSAALLWFIVVSRGQGTSARTLWREHKTVFMVCVANSFLASSLLLAGERLANSGIAGTLLSSIPLLAVLLARTPFFGSKRAGRTTLIGLAVGFTGIVLFYVPTLHGSSHWLGGVLLLLSAVCYTSGGLFINKWFTDADPVSLSALLCSGTMLTFIPWAVIDGVPAHPVAWGWVFVSGALSVGAGFLLYVYLIQRAGVNYTMSYAYCVPPLALALGVVFGGETVHALSLAGTAVIVVGLWLVLREESRQPDRRSALQAELGVPHD